MRSLFIPLNKTEDIIFFLSLLIAIIPFSAITPFISVMISLTFIALLFISIFLHFKKILLPVWAINITSLILFVLAILSFAEDIIMPSVEALTTILAIRFLGKKTAREYLQIYLIAVFLLGASTLFSISWFFLVRLILLVISTVFAILLLTFLKETGKDTINHENIKSLIKYAVFISFSAIPLSIFFFFILPRTPTPLIDIGFTKGKTGFTQTVNLGYVSTIEEDSSVVMRVKMKKINEENLYWRAITFDKFDGKNWYKTLLSSKRLSPLSPQKITYTVFLEPSTEQYLPVLDFPSSVYIKDIIHEYPGVFKTSFIIEKTLKYDATSFITSGLKETEIDAIYLQIPSSISKRIKNLTEKITTGIRDEAEIVKTIMQFLSKYKYSLKNLPTGANPLEDFLFYRKSGNCEYFATAMAVMLRIKGIPARVVGGFKGGIYNNFGEYYIIRASNAHLWVEAWIDGKWIRLDPSGSRQIRTSEPVIFMFLDYLWNNIVLNYDIKAQIKLFKSIKNPKIPFNKKLLFIPLILLFCLFSFNIYRHIVNKNLPLNKFNAIMSKYGYQRGKNQGLEEFIASIENYSVRNIAELFVKSYEEIYFKDIKFTKKENKKLNRILKELHETIKNARNRDSSNKSNS